jgi:acetoin utilization deacetylase AcuC-like enzyme
MGFVHTQACGFCIYDNIAVAVRNAQLKHRVQRVLVVDWDVHHGNGIQHTFEQVRERERAHVYASP